jgi:hypothetical protein
VAWKAIRSEQAVAVTPLLPKMPLVTIRTFPFFSISLASTAALRPAPPPPIIRTSHRMGFNFSSNANCQQISNQIQNSNVKTILSILPQTTNQNGLEVALILSFDIHLTFEICNLDLH